MPTAEKIRLIEILAKSGVREIEATSFTHPKWIPNLADAAEVVGATRDLGVDMFALIPNRRGLDRAVAAGIKGVTLVFSASDSHNRRNLNRPTEESLVECLALHREATSMGLKRRMSISTVFGCPFEGDVPAEHVIAIIHRLVDAGCDRIGLCDTVGVANPVQVEALCRQVTALFPAVRFELHLHNTRGCALANTLAGLQAGIDHFDAAIGGLGGCPYAPGATGNVATEDMVAMLGAMNIDTGIDLQTLMDADGLIARWRGQGLESALWRVGQRSAAVTCLDVSA